MQNNDNQTPELCGVAVLDDLIYKYYRELCEKVKENAKIGDFLKMVDLRRKISPTDAEQKKFWEMLDAIRKDVLSKSSKSAEAEQRREDAKRSCEADG